MAGNGCAARNMGQNWESAVVFDVDSLESMLPRRGDDRIITLDTEEKFKHIGWGGPGPWPYYMKVDILERLMFCSHNSSQQYGWFVWADVDVRIINATFPVDALLKARARYERAPLFGVGDGTTTRNSVSGEGENGASGVVLEDVDYNNIIKS